MVKSRATRRRLSKESAIPAETPVRAQKRTFSVSANLLEALDRMVTRGYGRSKNALVERALIELLESYLRYERTLAWKAASQDPEFLKDVDLTAIKAASTAPKIKERARQAS